MAAESPCHQAVPNREDVAARAEEADKELDSAIQDKQAEEVVQQTFDEILQLGMDYKTRSPENAKKLGSEKMLIFLTKSTFETLEKSGTPLTPEQKVAVEGMVKDFLARLQERKGSPSIALRSDGDSPVDFTPIDDKVVDSHVKEQPVESSSEQGRKIDLSVVKDDFKYMDAIKNLEDQLNGQKDHDKPIKDQMAMLSIANLLYSFGKKGTEPTLNGQVISGQSTMILTSAGDTITANVDNQYSFQYSRSALKTQLGRI